VTAVTTCQQNTTRVEWKRWAPSTARPVRARHIRHGTQPYALPQARPDRGLLARRASTADRRSCRRADPRRKQTENLAKCAVCPGSPPPRPSATCASSSGTRLIGLSDGTYGPTGHWLHHRVRRFQTSGGRRRLRTPASSTRARCGWLFTVLTDAMMSAISSWLRSSLAPARRPAVARAQRGRAAPQQFGHFPRPNASTGRLMPGAGILQPLPRLQAVRKRDRFPLPGSRSPCCGRS
jgi:hypothetical protein